MKIKLEDFKSNINVSDWDYYDAIKSDSVEDFKELGRIDLDIIRDCAHYGSRNIFYYIINNFIVDINKFDPFVAACESGNLRMLHELSVRGAKPQHEIVLTYSDDKEIQLHLELIVNSLQCNHIPYRFVNEETEQHCCG